MATLESCGRASQPPPMLRRMTISPKRKQQVFRLDKDRCLYCGSSSSKLEVDHILPQKAGGSPGCWKNLQTLCRPCNQRKTDQHIDYRTAKRRLAAERRCDCVEQPPPDDLEKLAAATGALHIARRHWYEALSAALSAGHPRAVAAAAGMSPPAPSPMIPPGGRQAAVGWS